MRLTRRRFLAQAFGAAALPATVPVGGLPRDGDDAHIGQAGRVRRGPALSARASVLVYPPLPDGARSFAPGEILRYAVDYGGLAAGEAALEVVGPTTVDEQKGLLVRYTAASRGLVRLFYKVNDRIESLLDPLFLFTRRYESWVEEGQRRRHWIVVFEPEEKRFRRIGSDGETVTGPLESDVVDGLGLVYHIRVRPLEPGGRLVVPLYRKETVTMVTLGASGKVVTDTPAGRFETLEVRPIGPPSSGGEGSGGLFGAALSIWLTTDRRRLPVRLSGSTRWGGSIDARLTSVRVGEINSPAQ